MSYTPTNWKKGDIVTSEKLNKLENGVAGVAGTIKYVDVTVVVDQQTQEVESASIEETTAELAEWIENGGYLVFKLDMTGTGGSTGGIYLPLTTFAETGNVYTIIATSVSITGALPLCVTLMLMEDGHSGRSIDVTMTMLAEGELG